MSHLIWIYTVCKCIYLHPRAERVNHIFVFTKNLDTISLTTVVLKFEFHLPVRRFVFYHCPSALSGRIQQFDDIFLVFPRKYGLAFHAK